MAGKKSYGYDVTVIYENDKDRFQCTLCTDIIKKATHGCDNHVFCRQCLEDYIESKSGDILECPGGCGQYFDRNQLKINNPTDQFINQIPCKCSECNWEGHLSDYVQHHKDNCIEMLIECNLCTNFVKRKFLYRHQTEDCTKRSIKCEDCSDEISVQHYDNHRLSCHQKESVLLKQEIQFLFDNYKKENEEKIKSIQTNISSILEENATISEQIRDIESRQRKMSIEVISKLLEENGALKIKNSELQKHIEKIDEKLSRSEDKNEKLHKDFGFLNERVDLLMESRQELDTLKLQMEELFDSSNNKISRRLSTKTKSEYSTNFLNVLSKESCREVFVLNHHNSIIIKKSIVSVNKIFEGIQEGNVSFLLNPLIAAYVELRPYKEELGKMINSRVAIRINIDGYRLLFRKDTFKCFEDSCFTLRLETDIITFESKTDHSDTAYIFITDWRIELLSNTSADLTKPDERFMKMEKKIGDNYSYLYFP